MKKVGVGIALQKMDAVAKQDCVSTCDDNKVSIKTEHTENNDFLVPWERSWKKLMVMAKTNSVQHQEWDWK
jgi:hypothetical protein